MHNHDRAVFPHHADDKPQNNPPHKGKDIPRNDVQTGQAIANQLYRRCHLFNDINLFHLPLSNHI